MWSKKLCGVALCAAWLLVFGGLCGCDDDASSAVTTTTVGKDGVGSFASAVTTKTGGSLPENNVTLGGETTTSTTAAQGGTVVPGETSFTTTAQAVLITTTSTRPQPTTTTTVKVDEVDKDSVPTAPPTQPPQEEKPVITGLTPLSREEYYGYSLLSKEANSSTLLAAYNRIVSGVEAMEEEINLNDPRSPITVEQLEKVWNYYQLDYPQHFWTSGNYGVSHSGGQALSIRVQYLMTKSERDTAQTKFDAAVKELLTGISGSWSDYQRELAVHDALCNRLTYRQVDAHSFTAYGALVNRQAVCEGYSEAFQYLMYQVGIQCIGVIGEAGGGPHKWNAIRIDGAYYFLDITWDDPVVAQGQPPVLTHNYFNIPLSLLQKDHVIVQKNGYPLPTCNSQKENYFVKQGGWLESLEEERVISALKKGSGKAEFYLANHTPTEFFSWFNEHAASILKGTGLNKWSYALSGSGSGVIVTLS